MKWFPGSIYDAVTTSKQRKAIFVVFIEGKDEISLEVGHAVNGSEVSSRLERDDFVAVRLESDTESYRFFQQIYQVVPVPSLFFIGTNGSPIEVISGAVTSADLTAKIDSILEKVGKKSVESSSNLIQAEENAASTTSPQPEVASDIGRLRSESSINEPSSSTNETRLQEIETQEKLERAKQLIELQRRQKLEKEREDEKRREIERRQMGKDIQAAKKKQYDADIKLAYDERQREKAAEAEAREKVRRQIAQDKLDRKQREEMTMQQNAARQQQEPTHERTSEPTASSSSASSGTVARIQFRLPSGNPHMSKFEPTSTLGSLRSYVAANIDLPFQKFEMSMTFPRRDLTPDDDDKTLTELELVPTAVILILPVKNSKVVTAVTSSNDVGFLSRFIWMIFSPVLSVYNYLMGYLNGGPTAPPEDRRGDGNVVASGRGISDNTERFSSIVGQASGSMRGNLLGGPATTIRSRGNIHRLHSGGDDNDENNTWNGNSTQQM